MPTTKIIIQFSIDRYQLTFAHKPNEKKNKKNNWYEFTRVRKKLVKRWSKKKKGWWCVWAFIFYFYSFILWSIYTIIKIIFILYRVVWFSLYHALLFNVIANSSLESRAMPKILRQINIFCFSFCAYRMCWRWIFGFGIQTKERITILKYKMKNQFIQLAVEYKYNEWKSFCSFNTHVAWFALFKHKLPQSIKWMRLWNEAVISVLFASKPK